MQKRVMKSNKKLAGCQSFFKAWKIYFATGALGSENLPPAAAVI